jgi:alpha-tubulin suppressor-like RCC1 family protein
VLKADGSLWSFGYNGDGRLGIGSYITKDIPVNANVLATYQDIKAGNDFIMVLREGGTVWTAGNNKSGQLGNGTTLKQNKLNRIANLTNIKKISAGKDYAIALDDYGIVYEWGKGILEATKKQSITQTVLDISCYNNQTAFVLAKGTIIGEGNILNRRNTRNNKCN